MTEKTLSREELIQKFHSPVIRMLYDEFIDKFGDESIREYYAEKGLQAFRKNGIHIGKFEDWCWKTPKYHHICRAIHIHVWRENVEKWIVEDLDNDYKKQIPEEHHKKVVFLVKEFPKIKELKEVVRILNRRWILKQLDLNLQKTDKREVFYKVRKIFGGKLKFGKSKKDRQDRIEQAVDEYYKHFYEFLGFEYWGYVPDYLEVDIKPTAIIFDMDMKETFLSMKNLAEFEKVPFFLIICEKTILIDFTMRGLINRGYNKGFYGISLGGYPVSAVIKYLIPLSKVRNFHIFVQHDLDVDGLQIYFDIKKWFPCESVGVNTDFLEHIGVGFDEIAEDYAFPELPEKQKKKLKKQMLGLTEKQKEELIEKQKEEWTKKQKEKQELGARNSVLKLIMPTEEREKYNKWIDSCKDRRAEINSLLTKREEEDYTKPKARDFINYLIKVIEDPERPWNLTRVRPLKKKEYIERLFSPETIWTIYTKLDGFSVWPTSIVKFDKKNIVKNKIDEEHKDYLDVLTEIGDLITTNTEVIEEKLGNLETIENKVIDNVIDKIKEEYPNLFDEKPVWEKVLQNICPGKVEIFNNLIKMYEKGVQFKNIRKYIELKHKLENYIGSIKGDEPEKAIVVKERELRKHTENNPALKDAKKRRRDFNAILQYYLRKTTEYKEAKTDITKLEEELENRVVEEDERKGVLNEFKEKLEKIFEDLIGELEELEEDEELEDFEIDYLEDE